MGNLEGSRERLDRKTLLQGHVPDELRREMAPSGLIKDYLNEFEGLRWLLDTGDPEPIQTAIEAFPGVRTYSGYCDQRIAEYNARAEEAGTTGIDPKEQHQLLVAEQPQARRINQLATRARRLASPDIPVETKLARFRIIYGQVQDIFATEEQDANDPRAKPVFP